jgi:hypothetical protein
MTNFSIFEAWLPKSPNHYTFTLKMANAMFAETLYNTQHSTRLTPESRSYTKVGDENNAEILNTN